MIERWLGNPLWRKELRQRMRSGRTVLAMSLYLFVIGTVAFVFMYVNVQGQTLLLQPTRTAELFMFLSYLQLAMISFVTPGIAAGAISGERERQTLSVLLTTPLSPGSIIIAKFISSISFLLLLIIMTLPLYSIVFLFGGVVPSQVLAVFGEQCITLLTIASVSVFWSTLLRKTGWSTVLSYATVAMMFLGSAIIGYFLDDLANHSPDQGMIQWIAGFCYSINPVYMQASLEATLGFITPAFHQPAVAAIFVVVTNHNLASSTAWLTFLIVYLLGSLLLLLASIWRLRPGAFILLKKRAVKWLLR
ncbi:MAG: ABC transporter permease subunit [Acidibacillus sp.]|nr:ABC transporter permease subunit [Acidibacillus sp.]